jgi:putative sterol carrier protein
MAVVYPSLEWMEAFKEKANSNEDYAKAAHDWEGDFTIEVSVDEMAVKELSDEKHMKAMTEMLMPSVMENLDGWKGTAFGDLMEKLMGVSFDELLSLGSSEEINKRLDPKAMAERFSKLTRDDLKGVKFCMWIDFWHGEVRSPLEIIPPGKPRDTRFGLMGSYTEFKKLVTGQADSIKLVMMGKLKLKGNLAYMMKRVKAVTMVTKIMGTIPIE